MKRLKEDSLQFDAEILVLESKITKGSILLEVYANDKTMGLSSCAGIRLTREQAREMAEELIRLADGIFFDLCNKGDEE